MTNPSFPRCSDQTLRTRSRYTSRDSMPKRRKIIPARPAPIQLPLFAESATLVRTLPRREEDRYYRLEVRPNLFGRALHVCSWSRSGTSDCHRLDPPSGPRRRHQYTGRTHPRQALSRLSGPHTISKAPDTTPTKRTARPRTLLPNPRHS